MPSDEETARLIGRVLGEDCLDASWFAEGFLSRVPLERVERVTAAARRQHGPLVTVRRGARGWKARYTSGSEPVRLRLTDDGRIAGLLIGPAARSRPMAHNPALTRLAVYLGVALSIGGPLLVSPLVWTARSPVDGMILAAVTLVMMTDLWLSGPWSMIGRPWRPLWALITAASLVLALVRASGLHTAGPGTWSLVLAVAALPGIDRIRRTLGFPRRPGGACELLFPLTASRYAVVQGGPAPLNSHARVAPQRWAIDVVELGRYGRRAHGLYPKALDRYEIYAQIVRSPCEGIVERAVDGYPDLDSPNLHPGLPEGNHVTIRTVDGLLVVLAHLQDQSVAVAPGDRVDPGRIVGRIGNSGNTSEPHLHLHVERGDPGDGEGVPMVFGEAGGRQLRRNDVIAIGWS